MPQDHSVTNRIRLTESDLKVVLTEGARMVELFYPDAVLARMAHTGSSEKELAPVKTIINPLAVQFWAGYDIEENDWLGFTDLRTWSVGSTPDPSNYFR